jgi:hypothetical protein
MATHGHPWKSGILHGCSWVLIGIHRWSWLVLNSLMYVHTWPGQGTLRSPWPSFELPDKPWKSWEQPFLKRSDWLRDDVSFHGSLLVTVVECYCQAPLKMPHTLPCFGIITQSFRNHTLLSVVDMKSELKLLNPHSFLILQALQKRGIPQKMSLWNILLGAKSTPTH